MEITISFLFGNAQLIDAVGVALQDVLLKVPGIGPGVVFCILQGHGGAFAVAVATFFFFLPASRCPALKQVVEPVAPAVVEEFFEDGFYNRYWKRTVGFFFPRAIVWKVMSGPAVRIEEAG